MKAWYSQTSSVKRFRHTGKTHEIPVPVPPVAAMQRRVSRTFLVFAAVTLLLAGLFFSTQNLQHINFEPHLPFPHVVPESKASAAPVKSSPEPPPRLSETVSHENEPNPYQAAVVSQQPDVAPQESRTSSLIVQSTPTGTTLASPTAKQPLSAPENATHASGNHTAGSLYLEITETNGWHDEVVAALVHSFGSQKNIELGIYQKNSRYGMSDIMKEFNLSHPLPSPQSPEVFKDAPDSSRSPDFVVATTCETDVLYLSERLNALLKQGKTFLYCIVHHADRWESEELETALSPWIEKDLMDFVTLSPHTANFLRSQGLQKWAVNISRPIKSFAPVFPVKLPPPTTKAEIGGKEELAFALQGNYEPTRRDFNGIFSSLTTFIERSSARDDEDSGSNVTLHLLGSGQRPEVPEGLQDHVYFDEGLSYGDFYSILSQTFALLPAFANGEYLDRKASSSVPASLLGATPLVATKEILAAYTYLPEEAVYLRAEGESELDVIGRVLQLQTKARKAKMMTVRTTCARLVEGNVELFREWVGEAVSRMEA